MKIRPTERYILFQRLFTFFDEWFFYLLLLYLYTSGASLWLFIPVAIIGAYAIGCSYWRLWDMEERCHE